MATTVELMKEFLRLINEFRAGQSPHVDYNDAAKNAETPQLANLVNNPLPALKMNHDLSAAAYMFSREMAENNFVGHDGINGSGPWHRAREVGYGFSNSEIAYGGGNTALAAFMGWYGSDGHRGGMMTQNATEIGVGFFDGKAAVKFGTGDTNPNSFVPEDVRNEIAGANYSDPIPQVPANQRVGTTNADIMNGDASNNILHGSWGNDNINGGAGDDTLYGGFDNDTLTGGAGADTFMLNSGDGFGYDIITDFQQGVDTYQLLHMNERDISLSVSTNNGRTDTTMSHSNGKTVAIFQGVDLTAVQGTPGDDNLTGRGGNEAIDGLAGNDTISGGAGSDTLNGGAGNDSLQGDGGNDVLNGNDGIDILKGGSGSDTLNGGAGNDSLEGNGGNDLINGDAGNDTLVGSNWSNDTLVGGAGDDVLDAGGYSSSNMIDYMTGGAGADTFVLKRSHFYYAGEGHAVITDFERGVDKLEGLWGNETKTAVTQNGRTDTVISLDGDTLAIIEGVDLTRVTGTNGDDILTGTSSSDTISGAAGNDSITGKGGHDLIDGDAGNDTLTGNAWSNDTLNGGAGDDLINGAAYVNSGESDVLTGGAGADTFVLDQRYAAYKGQGHATITDFEPGVDKIQGLWGATMGISDYDNDGQMDTILTRNNDSSDIYGVLQGVELTQDQFNSSLI